MENDVIIFDKNGVKSVGFTPANINASIKYIKENKIQDVFFEGKKHFENFDFLKTLNLNSIAINYSSIDTSKFPVLDSLKILYLNDFDGTLSLLKFPNLYECNLDWNNKINFIEEYNIVKKIIIWKYNSKSKTLKELSIFNNIEYMQINNTNITSLEHIDLFSKLNHFELNYATKLSSLEYIDLLKHTLKELFLDHVKQVNNFNIISTLKNLRLLVLSDCNKIENVNFVNKMPNLKDFRIVNTDIVDGNLFPLKKIETVRIYPFKKHYSLKQEDFDK